MRAADQATLRARVLAPGTRVGRYTIVERIAAGGMAELYLARARGIGGFDKLLALKLVLPHLADDPEFIAMFLDEARLAATLDHPNVVHVLDIGQVGAEHFYAMEYVHGRDLRALVRALGDAPIPLPCALAIILGTASGLHHAHERMGHDGRAIGLVHRDVSPSNVLVTYDGVVKVVDFGIARAEARSKATRAGVVKGKQGYMSPEQCRGDTVDRTSDVFGLGILLWELTVGKRLFTGDNDYAVMSKIVFGMVPDPRELVPGYPPRLAEIVMRALQRDPAARQRSALQLALELEAFAHGEHLQISGNSLAELMQQCFGDHPYPTPGLAREPEIDEDAATRIAMVEPTRKAPPSRTVVAAAVSVPVLVVGLAAAWMLAVRPNAGAREVIVDAPPADEVPREAPPPAVAATEVDAPREAPPAIDAAPASDDEPELIEGASTPSPGKSKRTRSDDRSRTRASADATPVASSPARPDRPRAPIPDRPNELFPPDEGPRAE